MRRTRTRWRWYDNITCVGHADARVSLRCGSRDRIPSSALAPPLQLTVWYAVHRHRANGPMLHTSLSILFRVRADRTGTLNIVTTFLGRLGFELVFYFVVFKITHVIMIYANEIGEDDVFEECDDEPAEVESIRGQVTKKPGVKTVPVKHDLKLKQQPFKATQCRRIDASSTRRCMLLLFVDRGLSTRTNLLDGAGERVLVSSSVGSRKDIRRECIW